MCRERIEDAIKILRNAHYMEIKDTGAISNVGIYIEFNSTYNALLASTFFCGCILPKRDDSSKYIELGRSLLYPVISLIPFPSDVLKTRKVLALLDLDCYKAFVGSPEARITDYSLSLHVASTLELII